MKRLSFIIPFLSILIIACLSFWFTGCDKQPSEPISNSETNSLNKVVSYDETWVIDFDDVTDDYYPYLYTDCVTGVVLQMHGKVLAYQKVKVTPSGNTIWNGGVDYDYFDPIYLTGDTEIWNLYKGLNPFHDMAKEDGTYRLNFTLHEFYKTESGKKLKILIEGRLTISEDGTEFYRENFKCIQNPKK